MDRPKRLVLLIDNEKEFAFFVRANLERSGAYEVVTAHSGYEGLQRAAVDLPDVIVLDILMPAMNGLQILERLKSDDATRAIPVIMSTAVRDEEERARAERLGAAAYLEKPFGMSDLVAAIDGACRGGRGI